MSEIALDIETVGLVDDPDLQEKGQMTPFAVGIAYRDEYGAIESEVLLRKDHSHGAERELLRNTAKWISSHPHADTLITYNGADFDLPILSERAEEVSRPNNPEKWTVRSILSKSIDGLVHRDLLDELRSLRHPTQKWPKLEQACEARSIEMEEVEHKQKTVTGEDMLWMGRAMMLQTQGTIPDIWDAMLRYAQSDVAPLFELADQVNFEQRVQDGGSLARGTGV